MSLAHRLREATDAAHSDAERSTFITDLMAGEGSVADYVALIGQYAPLYEALEEGVRATDAAPLDAFADPRLERSALIRADLAALGAPADATEPLPSTAEYVQRLRSLTGQDPVRLLAHHYLRYLGDLSGGQAIASRVRRHYDIPAEQLTMWDFDLRAKPYKDAYRAKLSASLAAPDDEAAFVDECLQGYRLAGQLFVDLQQRGRRTEALASV